MAHLRCLHGRAIDGAGRDVAPRRLRGVTLTLGVAGLVRVGVGVRDGVGVEVGVRVGVGVGVWG